MIVHIWENSSCHMLWILTVQVPYLVHYLVFSSHETSTSFTLMKLSEKIERLYFEFFQSRMLSFSFIHRHVRTEDRPTNTRRLPRSHNPWRPSSSQRIAGRPTGVINCYSRVLDPSDSSVLRSSVLVARGDLFFELPHSIRGSPFLPQEEPPSFTRPTPTQETLRPLLALLFASLSLSVSLSVSRRSPRTST